MTLIGSIGTLKKGDNAGIFLWNKCATLFYGFPYLRADMLHLTDIILFLVCAYIVLLLLSILIVAVTTIS
ncbi:hypothetical protein ACJX0J_024454, partial [Zea mays]